MTHDASHAYSYDAENHITKVDGGTTATYPYDANGTRIEQVTPGGGFNGATQAHFWYDTDGHIRAMWDQNGNWMIDHFYLGDEYIGSYSTFWVFKDLLGSSRILTDVNQGLEGSIDYLPFGEQQTGSTWTSLKFTGKERDTESNLDNFGARYNSSSLGRFMSPDPGNFGAVDLNPQSWNGYSYMVNNPLSGTDPDGLDYYLLGGDQCGDEVSCDQEGYITDEYGNRVVITDQAVLNGTYTLGTDANGNATITTGQGTFQAQFFDPTPPEQQAEATVCPNGCDTPLNSFAQEALPLSGRWADAGVKGAMVLTAPEYLAAGGAIGALELSGSGASGLSGESGLDLIEGTRGQVLKKLLGNEQKGLLRQLFDTGERPEGLTERSLQVYKEIAQRTIADGKDIGGEQARRLDIIERILK